ncbi:hypothetical protein DFH08DRAFT_1085464 [Mycena albidolilacea]|uniref:Uncharacterized protein n=1 Tax=Mycena albidolilacea TaxID=1033008 RepID=A0AAD6ZIS5_9AGAR|nr:hypothetical protein DFH08DRAFT_1085464 [Mycena albidolilacea]
MSLILGPRSWTPDTAMGTQVILGLIIPGVVLTTAVLSLYGYAAWNPISRQYLDRVSFRLLVYALLSHLVFGIAFTLASLMAYPGWRCDLSWFFASLSLMFSAGMFFCMALNLPLVIAHNVNGQNMEKYYVLGTTLVCLICNLVPYASGKFGWDTRNDTCWYRDTNQTDMLRWLIGTETVWMMLASAGEVGAFLIIVGYLIAYELDMRRFHTGTRFKTTYSSEAPHRTGLTILKFRSIILRIGLYPLVSCMLNISASVLDLYEVKHLESTELNWRLNLADLAIYCGRPLIYGLLAATDPSFIRALRALRHPEDDSETQPYGRGVNAPWPAPSICLTTFIDMPSNDSETQTNKDDERGYGSHAHIRAGETSTLSVPTSATDQEVGKQRRRAERHDQSWMTTTVVEPTQPVSIDVVCHI